MECLRRRPRSEFVRLFRLLLLKNYANQIDRYADQRIDYLDEQTHNGRVLVRTRLIAPHRALLLDFWLFERLGDWLVYDVVVDGISLIQNYRGQIMYVLRTFHAAGVGLLFRYPFRPILFR
jgi:phospholipid transport system substrate-binding protein